MVNVILRGKVVMKGRNLAPILRYQRKAGIVVTCASQSGRKLNVKYNDGAHATATFVDASVLKNWIAARRKSGIFPAKCSRRKK